MRATPRRLSKRGTADEIQDLRGARRAPSADPRADFERILTQQNALRSRIRNGRMAA
jgi:hypothetical protein